MLAACTVLSWNFRGAKSDQFTRSIKELIREHRPKIVVILEPRISGHEVDLACRRIGYPDWVRYEARGFSEGIWILWNGHDISLKVIHAEFRFIHVLIREADGRAWEMSAIYASPNCALRPALWR